MEAVPEIARFVQIQPSAFGQVAAGQPETVRLTFNAPSGAQFGAYDGTVHIRTGSRTIPQTLQASVTYAVVPLPPDPGEAGKISLQGIDSDGDGVRDDVERLIAFMPIPVDQLPVVFNTARTMQQVIMATTTDSSIAVQLIRNDLTADNCLIYVVGTEAPSLATRITAVMLNTESRLVAYSAVDSKFGGQTTIGIPKGQDACQMSF